LRNALCKVRRQHAETGPDLEHDVGLVELREAADHAEDVFVGEEVLPELLLRSRAHWAGEATGSQKAAVALASIRSPSSPTSSPRTCASVATVWTTFAGSFGRPRRGTGAR